ncbi:nucleoside kinase [Paenibacillus sp. TAB 01]|uniref:nucleoside kinase n=1 Tax=Paenibacillus sp. TAB 01 TaxID=3368988 RepID=UPI00375364D2
MATVCVSCGEYVETAVDREKSLRKCPTCHHEEAIRMLPLFIVTGASGVGKTTTVKHLRPLLENCDVFDTDEMKAESWEQARSNWLKVAFQIAQSGRCTVLCGTMMPWDVEACDHYRFFRHVYYLNLHCGDDARAERLRSRPSWRNTSEAFIEEHRSFAGWLLDHAATDFDPPMPVVDSTARPVEETAGQIRDWVNRWRALH